MTELSTELLITRGKYATLRAEYREAAARMTKFGQYATTAIATIGNSVQAGLYESEYFATAEDHLAKFLYAAGRVASIHKELAELKPEAWPGE